MDKTLDRPTAHTNSEVHPTSGLSLNELHQLQYLVLPDVF